MSEFNPAYNLIDLYKLTFCRKIMKRICLILIVLTTTEVIVSQNLTNLISQSEKAVCLITTFDNKGNVLKIGTGFFIDERGLCVSNYHMFEGCHSYQVTDFSRNVYSDIEVLKSSRFYDIIVFNVPSYLPNSYLPIAPKPPEKGERIITIGNPQGLTWSASEGIISNIYEDSIGNIYQITAPISKGSSGSPLINLEGYVIGIVTLNVYDGQNLNFALPITLIDSIATNDFITDNLNSSILSDEFEIFQLQIDSLITITLKYELDQELINSIQKQLTKFIEKYPSSAFGYIKSGQFYQNIEDPDKAYQMFTKAIAVDTNEPEAYLQRAIFLIYNTNGSFHLNEDSISKIILEDLAKCGTYGSHYTLESYNYLSIYYDRIGDIQKSIDYDTKYITEFSDISEAVLLSKLESRANKYWLANQTEEAIRDCDRALAIAKKCSINNLKFKILVTEERFEEASSLMLDECLLSYDYEHLFYRGLVLYQIDGDLDKAKSYLDRAINLIDKYAAIDIFKISDSQKYYILRAIISEELGYFEDALNDILTVQKYDSTIESDYPMSIWVIRLKSSVGDYLGALQGVNRLIEKFPNEAELFEKKGEVLFYLGDYIGSLKSFDKAFQIQPNNGNYLRLRGLAKLRSGDKLGACEDWSKAGDMGEIKAYEHIQNYCKKNFK